MMSNLGGIIFDPHSLSCSTIFTVQCPNFFLDPPTFPKIGHHLSMFPKTNKVFTFLFLKRLALHYSFSTDNFLFQTVNIKLLDER